MEPNILVLFKVLAGICVAGGIASALGVGVSTYWLLWETADDEKAKRIVFRMRGVPALALRGEWPTLSSARYYRWFFRALMTCWIAGALSVIAHEVVGALL